MFAKHLTLWGVLFGLLAMHATLSSAQELTAAVATVGCSCGQSTIKITATGLTAGANYVVDYSITVTPNSGSPIAISSAIDFTANASTETDCH